MEKRVVISIQGALAAAALAATGLMGCAPSVQESHLTPFGRFGRSVDVSSSTSSSTSFSTSSSTAVVGAHEERGATANEEGAAYVFFRPIGSEVWSPEARLKPASTGDLHFGEAVAISGNTIAVAAPQETLLAGVHTGVVHIFDRNGVTWTESAQISTLVHQGQEGFGSAVALTNDTLVVGAVGRDQAGAVDAGAVFVYQRSGTIWTLPPQALLAPSPAAGDNYGSAVDVAGDTLVVAALRRDVPGAVDAGAVFVYRNISGTWTWAQTLTASDRAAGDIFGTSVDLELHVDGSRRLVVGAEGCDVAGVGDAGAVYVFDAPAGGSFSPTETQKLVAPDPTGSAIFGDDVSVSGGRILVGAPQATGGVGRSGAAYVFELDDGVSTHHPDKLMSPANQTAGAVGASVALSGESALIGAMDEHLASTLTSPGAVHVFVKPAMGSWLHGQTLTATAGVPRPQDELFARRVSLGADRLVTSGHSHADVFVRDGKAWSEEQPLPALSASQVFDASTDGATVAVFGHRNNNTDPIGYVQTYTQSSRGMWIPQEPFDPDLVSVMSPWENANDAELAILGDTMALGAPRWNDGQGRVFIWKRAEDGTWSQQGEPFMSPQAAPGVTTPYGRQNFDMNYGRHVRLNGQTLVVAEVPSGALPGYPQTGNVYIFTKQGDLFVQNQVITEAVLSGRDYFGGGVAIDGDLLAVYSSTAQILHVYRRTGVTFDPTPVWSLAIPGVVVDSDKVALAMKGDRIAIGLPAATVDGVANVGQVAVYARQPPQPGQPDDTYTYTQEHLFAATVEANLRLGLSVDMDATHVVAGTDSAFGRVYSFDL